MIQLDYCNIFSIGLKPPTSNVFTSFSCKLSQRFQIIYLEEDHDKEEADLRSRCKMGQADDGVNIKLTNVYSKLCKIANVLIKRMVMTGQPTPTRTYTCQKSMV